jgi:ABC-2 type transport system ATP-binding protein
MIQVSHLDKNYGPTRALHDVSFDIARGEVVGLLGPNGAGKTTMLRILSGYMPPSGGRASIAGFDVFEDSLEARRRIGYLPESAPLYGEMTVRAYLHYRASLYRLPGRQVSNRREAVEHAAVQRAMSACGIAGRADSLIDHLSKGLRQRVGLAQAIVHDPEVLILDEPTIGLDPRQIQEVRQLIRDLGRERTILLSSHILPEVSQVCNRVLILHHGRLAAKGTPDELTARLQGASQVRIQVRAPEGAPVAAVLGRLPGITDVQPQADAASGDVASGGVYLVSCAPDANARPQLIQAILQAGWELLELRAEEMSLEEVFMQLTVDEDREQETRFFGKNRVSSEQAPYA